MPESIQLKEDRITHPRGERLSRRAFLKWLFRGAALVTASQVLPMGLDSIQASLFTNEANRRLENPTLSKAEKEKVRQYLHVEPITGPLQVSRKENNSVEIQDDKGNEVPTMLGVDAYSAMNSLGYFVQPGEGWTKPGEQATEEVLISLKELGVCYIRILFSPRTFDDKQATDQDYIRFQSLLDLLAKHGMGAEVILNYWQGFSTNQDHRLSSESFSDPVFIEEQKQHLQNILGVAQESQALWKILFTNELVLTQGRDLLKSIGVGDHLADFFALIEQFRTQTHQANVHVPISTGFLTALQSGYPEHIVRHTLLSLVSRMPELYSHLDSFPLTVSQEAFRPLEDSELRGIREDHTIPLELAEIGVRQNKKPRSNLQLQQIASFLGLYATTYQPQNMAIWQVISANVKREDFDEFAITIDELKTVMKMFD